MRPQSVDSPKDRLSELSVVHNAVAEGWSVATCMWREEDGTQSRRVGIRWNGDENELGHPQSTGHATWFLLPENLIAEFVEMYAARRERGDAL